MSLVPSVGASAPATNLGLMALGALNEDEFKSQLDALSLAISRLDVIKSKCLTPGIDFDVVPGTDKPTLLQPGAQKIALICHFIPDAHAVRTIGDGVDTPSVHYSVIVRLHLGTLEGPVVGVGVGSASTFEKKHRYRRGDRVCPKCAKSGSVIKGKEEFGGGWLCWEKKGGCSAKFADGDATIEKQVIGDVQNPDPYDLDNTVLKMGKKRAFVDAVLTATASSGMFTQDMEDLVNAETRDEDKRALAAEYMTILKDNGVAKNADAWALNKQLLGRECKDAPKELSVAQLRGLVERLRQHFKKPGDAPTAEPADDGRGEA